MKYDNKKFGIGAQNQTYKDNWDSVFGDKEEEPKYLEDLEFLTADQLMVVVSGDGLVEISLDPRKFTVLDKEQAKQLHEWLGKWLSKQPR